MSDYADDVVKRRLEGVPGVGSVRLVGQREREIRIWLRIDALRAHGVAAKDVIENVVEHSGPEMHTCGLETVSLTLACQMHSLQLTSGNHLNMLIEIR